MQFNPIDFTIEKLGSILTGYSTKLTWIFYLSNKKQYLTLEITYLTGWKKVSLNNRELTIT